MCFVQPQTNQVKKPTVIRFFLVFTQDMIKRQLLFNFQCPDSLFAAATIV